MTYRQGNTTEARAALRKIVKPDANVFLQMALISLEEENLQQAEGEFERAWLGGSGGTVYVIHRDDQPRPPRGRGPSRW